MLPPQYTDTVADGVADEVPVILIVGDTEIEAVLETVRDCVNDTLAESEFEYEIVGDSESVGVLENVTEPEAERVVETEPVWVAVAETV